MNVMITCSSCHIKYVVPLEDTNVRMNDLKCVYCGSHDLKLEKVHEQAKEAKE